MIDIVAHIIGYIVLIGGMLLAIVCGLDLKPVPGVTKLTFYDFGFVIINKHNCRPKLLHIMHRAYVIWNINFRYAIAPSFPVWCYRLYRALVNQYEKAVDQARYK